MLKNASIYIKRHNLFPGLRKFVQKHFDVAELRAANWTAQNPYDESLDVSDYKSAYPYTLGILKEFWHRHWHYISACRDLGVSYKVLDISGPDWMNVVESANCDAYLAHPSVQFSMWKQMYDERLRIMIQALKMTVFPGYEELWMWESKRRMHYWLKANSISHPQTWIFYDRLKALQFAEEAQLPLVYKSNMGSGASGVKIFRDRSSLRKHINICFRKGYTNDRRGPNDKEVGSIFLQEYLTDAREWRVVRIGESYFGFEKLKAGDFHSGSHLRSYSRPPAALLDFAKGVFDRGQFPSMSLDIFITKDGRYLVNELQTYFGIQDNHEMCVIDGKAGRMICKQKTSNEWDFEAGSFCQNYLYNQRVICVLNLLEQQSPGRQDFWVCK